MAITLESFASKRHSLLRSTGNLIRTQHVRRVLEEKTSPRGAKWAPLKPSTVERKGNSNILVESGKMAWAWQLSIGGSFVIMRNTATSSRGGARYLGFHQWGTKKMVARPVMGFSDRNLHEIHYVVEAWIAKRLAVAA